MMIKRKFDFKKIYKFGHALITLLLVVLFITLSYQVFKLQRSMLMFEKNSNNRIEQLWQRISELEDKNVELSESLEIKKSEPVQTVFVEKQPENKYKEIAKEELIKEQIRSIFRY